MHQELGSVPSQHIDVAICGLVAKISNFSDDHFDANWMHLTEPEIEALAIALIQHWTEQLEGRLLGGLLLAIREKAHIPD